MILITDLQSYSLRIAFALDFSLWLSQWPVWEGNRTSPEVDAQKLLNKCFVGLPTGPCTQRARREGRKRQSLQIGRWQFFKNLFLIGV